MSIEFFGMSFTDFGDMFVSIIIPVIYGVIIILPVFYVYRSLTLRRAFTGDGRRLWKLKVNLIGKYMIMGNLSVHDEFNQTDALQTIKQDPRLEPVAKVLDEIIGLKQIYAYYLKVIDNTEAFDIKGNSKRTIILSTEKLESENISWISQKGERNWINFGEKEFTRQVDCYTGSQYFEIENEDENYDDYYIIEPIPLDPDSSKGTRHEIKINRLEGGKQIAKSVSFMTTLAESLSENKIKDEAIANFEKIIEKKDQELFNKNARINRLRHLLNQKVYVGYGKAQIPLIKGVEWGWMLAFWIAGAGGFLISNEMPQLTRTIPPIGFAIIGLMVVAGLRTMKNKQKEIDETIEAEEIA